MGNSKRRVFHGLWTAIWRYRRRTMAALVLLVLAKLAAVSVPLLLKAIVDRFSLPPVSTDASGLAGSTATIVVLPVFLLLGYALVRFAGTLFTELRDLVFVRVTQQTVGDFAQRTFAHLVSLSPRFHVQRNTGSLIRDVERGTGGVGFLLGAGLFTLLPTLVEFVAVLLIMSAGYSLWFAAVIVTSFFVYATYTAVLTERRAARQRHVNEIDSRANGRFVDSLLNYETVKTYAREEYERARYASVLSQRIEASVENQKALSLLHLGQGAIIAAGVAAVMLLAGQETLSGRMTVGDLVLVNSYLIQICLPLNALGFVFREARDALVNTERLFDLLGEPPEIVDRPKSAALDVRGGGAISFENVNFSYEPGRQILRDVSLSVDAGKTVAVVGGSGSGKSTLARLLLRLYDPDEGSIRIDGQDLREVSLASLRDAIGVVPQDTVLFNDTIAYNIAYGRQGAGMAEVVEAAKAAQVHEFIMSLPEQYDTVVGERGLKLSGGEKQRVAIARAFVKNPPIMIFDEATSALDTRAERAIQRELDRIAEGRTTLIIAHRLSTIVNADEIVVMDRGRVAERGKHEELLEREGLYAQLWNLQRQQQQLERLERRLARQPVNLAVLVADTIEAIRPATEARRIRLYTDLDLENATVTGDPGTLARALRELGLAALQATPDGGRIEFRLERRESEARVAITDGRHARSATPPAEAAPAVGAAVLDQEMSAVPAVAGLTAEAGGTPLDPLALRSAIERQGGRFTVEPVGSATGVRFLIDLPLRALETPSRLAGPGAPATLPVPGGTHALAGGSARPLEGLQVLCIDDDVEAREALEVLLEAAGAAVLAFEGGRPALAWLEERASTEWPQLLVCDIVLGDEDGHAVVRRIRRIEAQREVALEQRLPAVALTGRSQPDDRIRALMAGFQAHFAKPIDPDALIEALASLAGRG